MTTLPEPSPYPGSAAERLEQFAGYLRSRGHGVGDGPDAVRWLAEGVERTRSGERWFDTSTQGPANRVFDESMVVDRLEAGHEGADALNQEFHDRVAELSDRGQVVPGARTVGLSDTPDGEAITKLEVRDPEMREYFRWHGGPDPVQVQDAVACQYARDGRSDLDTAERDGQAVRVDQRQATEASGGRDEGRSAIDRALHPDGAPSRAEAARTQTARMQGLLDGSGSSLPSPSKADNRRPGRNADDRGPERGSQRERTDGGK